MIFHGEFVNCLACFSGEWYDVHYHRHGDSYPEGSTHATDDQCLGEDVMMPKGFIGCFLIWGSHRKLDKIGMMYEDMESVWFLLHSFRGS